jgi:hypothetical protein
MPTVGLNVGLSSGRVHSHSFAARYLLPLTHTLTPTGLEPSKIMPTVGLNMCLSSGDLHSLTACSLTLSTPNTHCNSNCYTHRAGALQNHAYCWSQRGPL